MKNLKTEEAKVIDLVSDPNNARKHSDRNIDAIAASLSEFGQRKPIVIQGQVVLAGNGTLAAATRLGWDTITVTRVPADWSEEQARAYALADNRSAELAEWDYIVLAQQLEELDPQFDLVEAYAFDPPAPPPDAFEEWTDMPDFKTEDKNAVFSATMHFRTPEDADKFFEMVGREKAKSVWWPENDGHVGSTVKAKWVKK